MLTHWDRADLGAHVDEVLDVYAEAMQVPLSAARTRRGLLLGHLDRVGLQAVAALEQDRLVGIAYGYVGEPGQWWHDQVRASMTAAQAAAWLTHAFEVCEFHVRPAQQGQGCGRALLETLLAGTDAATGVLTTPDQETRARRFYRADGWVDVVRGLRFPGDPRSFAVLGKQLHPVEGRGSSGA
jgi:GNAT superfamily N-acetyltransferase